jgi:hypothetical protein
VGLDRRSALRRLALAGALTALPWRGILADDPPWPDSALLQSDPERFWTTLRSEQFLLDDNRIFLNPGSLGVTPRPVLQAVFDSLNRAAKYATDEIVRWGYDSLEADSE